MAHIIYILLGSNLGDRMVNLATARWYIEHDISSITRESAVYESAAWGKTDQPDFLNQVVVIETQLRPKPLLKKLLLIEKEMGRKRTTKWAERNIDIDILLYNSIILSGNNITIPHPGIPTRRFTLIPLNELAPDYVHPQLGITISEMLANCTDPLPVKRLD